MTERRHNEVTQASFAQQVGLFSGETALFAQRSAAAWLEPLDAAMILLDVACGAGHAAETAAPHVRQVVGLDLTRPLLELGASRLDASGVANVLLQEGDAASLPFMDGSFDLVFCRSAVHHFPRPERVVAEMARVCRPGGRVVVSDMTVPSPAERRAFDDLHRLMDPSHAGALLERELVDLLATHVGAVTSTETTGPFALSIDHILTEAGDRAAVLATLRAELDGGPATGFLPVVDPDDPDGLLVSFSSTVLQATRPE
jgi:ubiquinone/menaquinone biosynthesis C-methylase UbiE